MFTDWFWVEYLTVPFAWVDENFFLVYFGLQGLLVVVLFIFAESKSKALIVIPLYIAGFSAFILIFAQMIWGLIISLFVLRLALPAETTDHVPDDPEWTAAREADEAVRERRQKAEREARGQWHYNKTVLGWKSGMWRGW
jgi:Zn-dependent protease with chaperone function